MSYLGEDVNNLLDNYKSVCGKLKVERAYSEEIAQQLKDCQEWIGKKRCLIECIIDKKCVCGRKERLKGVTDE